MGVGKMVRGGKVGALYRRKMQRAEYADAQTARQVNSVYCLLETPATLCRRDILGGGKEAAERGARERERKAEETKSGSWLNLNYTVRAASPEPKLGPGILISARIARRTLYRGRTHPRSSATENSIWTRLRG